MREHIFYNAINSALESNYGKLLKFLEKFRLWETSWNHLDVAKRQGINPETEWRRLEKLGIELILQDDEKFPAILKEIPLPPFGIYLRGLLPINEFSLAIIGTRKASNEGKGIAKRFSRELAEKNFAIISGLALGIDAAAHDGCLDVEGKTVAVLANGLDSIYPKTHHSLAKKILNKNGALISEYPPGAPPFPPRFLERNRIISGLARGTLVVEAPERSGSLATARFAIDQNREVFVIPGSISSQNFLGSNRLIRSGAQLVTRLEDILETFGIEIKAKAAEVIRLESDEERLIYAALQSISHPADVEAIMEITNLTVAEANTTLSFLIVKNIVKETEGGYTLEK
ncbi:MAG: DNA-processing protein DprA [Patescibacteria group bacterium]